LLSLTPEVTRAETLEGGAEVELVDVGVEAFVEIVELELAISKD
jgi:hypothetical protein